MSELPTTNNEQPTTNNQQPTTKMVSVDQAEHIILSCKMDYGITSVPLVEANGRVLAEDITADRDLPPFNRVAMDGIAIRYQDYENGTRIFEVTGAIGAGEKAPHPLSENTCFEIMTGAAMPADADTVVPYEHLSILDGMAELSHPVLKRGQNIHRQASDHQQGTVLIPAGQRIGPVEISVAASAGKARVMVKNLPRVVIFSSGNELVDVTDTPLPFQIRRSNNFAVNALLQPFGIQADMLHVTDELDVIQHEIEKAIDGYEVIILSGGISMGKFDFIPQALENAGVQQRFHRVRQRPGKPFWFGTYGDRGVVFALPGNPVSTFLCLLRYTLPWLEASLGLPVTQPDLAVLAHDVHFEPALQYFLQVRLQQDEAGVVCAHPLKHNGSGDYASLLQADGFLELPEHQTTFNKGTVLKVWRYR